MLLSLCCCSRCYVTRSVFVKVCFAVFALDQSLQTSHDQHHRSAVDGAVQSEHHRDTQAEHHRDVCENVQPEHHTSFVELVHRQIREQLTTFICGGSNSSVMWHPYVVTYYAELTTLCLRDSLASSEDFMSLLTDCLNSSVYDIRLAALKFLASAFGGKNDHRDSDDDDADDDEDDEDDDTFELPASSHSTDMQTDKLLSQLMSPTVDDSVDLHQVLVDKLLSTETHDECLVMVSNCFL